MRSIPTLLLILALSLATLGCATSAGQWAESVSTADHEDETLDPAIIEARSKFKDGDDQSSLRAAIDSMERLLDRAPSNRKLRVDLAEAHTLLGAAYATSRGQKRSAFLAAQHHAEQALLTRPEFRNAIRAGQRSGLAAEHLEKEDVPAMVIWATATAYLFDEGMTPIGRALNYRGLEDLRLIMERALDLNPEYEYGLVPFSLAIFHIATPGFAGGDLDQAKLLMEQAIDTPGHSLMPRWGRARYLHPLTSDQESRRADLEWILAQDAHMADSPYHWNVYVQRDARRMLAELD